MTLRPRQAPAKIHGRIRKSMPPPGRFRKPKTPPTSNLFRKPKTPPASNLFRKPKTPPRPKTLPPDMQFYDTPMKRSTLQSNRMSELVKKRQAILDDLGQTIPEASISMKLSNLSKKDKQIIKGTWKHFQIEPKFMKGKGNNEEKVFEHLRDTFDSIVKAANKTPHDHKQTLALHTDPYITPTSEKASTTKPDGSLMLKESENKVGSNGEMTKPSWYDYAVTLEAKKSDGGKDLDDDVAKEIFNMQHVMSLDPCRRFTFGITIENNNTRLWFCSRAVMIVSKPFNFRKDLKTLTRVFLSFAFASKTELGWDPTVSVSIENGIRVYHFTMDDEVFSTVKVMSDVGADAVIGRASRVFKVKRKDGTLAILKDVWVDDDRELEHTARNIVKRHLMTPVQFGLVEVDGQTDHTTNVIMRGEAPPFINTFRLVPETHPVNDAQQSAGHPRASDRTVYYTARAPQENARNEIHHRHHYRLVFKEIGETLYLVKNLSDVLAALQHISAALEYIHGAGWVHRDISAGNTYLYNKRGLLGDLEYAKKMGVNAKHEVRTGTLDFMAVEIADRIYKFLPRLLSEEIFAREKEKSEAQMQDSEDELEYSDEEADELETAKKRPGTSKGIEERKMPIDSIERPDTANQKRHTVCNELATSKDVSDDFGEGQDEKQTLNNTKGRLDSSNASRQQDAKILDEMDDNKPDAEAGDIVRNVADEQEVKPRRPGVWYNTLHDMESIWWIAIWKLFLHEDLSERSTRTETERINQAKKANLLFPHLLITTERFYFFDNEDVFEDLTSFLPASFKKVAVTLNKLRASLQFRYARAEAKGPNIIDQEAFIGVHSHFVTFFREGKRKASGIVAVTFKRPGEKSNDSIARGSQSVAKRKAEDERPPSLINDTSKRRRSFSFSVDAGIPNATIMALMYIHGVGWVRRNISAGNTYLYNKRGILGDLEYAKKMGDNAKYEVRTGALDFMAVEVSERTYKFLSLDLEEIFSQRMKKVIAKADSFEDERPCSEDELTSDKEAIEDSGRVNDLGPAGEILDGEAKKGIEELRLPISTSEEPVIEDQKPDTARNKLAASESMSVDPGRDGTWIICLRGRCWAP
ncbi:hypothetical protein EW145_g6042 [Phellinidium pouzarii]|uniref:Fungal-type protein kinase domain-containing protein n=1 Tax=Phellinidium pouzarii TaxID=167371 RepID=A0A4V3XBY2_9AGAM|nr:hypothetical protein EW145_g6042 [Phellinidium pouzarii]